jgi:hypothetical protein
VFFTTLGNWNQKLKVMMLFAIVGGIISIGIDTHWLLKNFMTTGNPIFPNYSDVFRSDWVAHSRFIPYDHLPKDLFQALFYPAYWSFAYNQLVTELNMQDPRMFIGELGALAIVIGTIFKKAWAKIALTRFEMAGLFLAIFFMVSLFLWEYLLYSNYRFLAVPETLAGFLLVNALAASGFRSMPTVVVLIFGLTVGMASAVTHYPWWDRIQSPTESYHVTLPPIEANSMVVLLDAYAYSYLVPFMPSSVRVIGASNSIVSPSSTGKLKDQVVAAISTHNGPMWGIEDPGDFPESADRTLSFYRLQRGQDCSFISTNIEIYSTRHLRMCRLDRLQ